MYNKDKYLELLDSPVLGQLFLTATTDVEERIKELTARLERVEEERKALGHEKKKAISETPKYGKQG